MTDGPESFIYGDACEKWSVDLVVSGKTLGGKAVIPFKGGVFGGSQGYFPEYVHGLYKKGDVILFITSGLSPVFPEGIPVGIVENSTLKDGDSYHTIRVRLNTNFKRLKYVEVVQNEDLNEMEELQHGLD